MKLESVLIMADNNSSTGYGPRRLSFNGDETKYELWELKFLGYMRLQKLEKVFTGNGDPSAEDNATAFAELIQFMDDKSLSLIIRDAKDDGKKSLQILRNHYIGDSKPRILSLYTVLTSLKLENGEELTDYIIRAERASAALKNAGETVSDGLLVAMILKGLPSQYKPFITVITQDNLRFIEFKTALRSYEEQ
jgi:hypothetical protein